MATTTTTTTTTNNAAAFNMDAFFGQVTMYRQLPLGEHTCIIEGIDQEKSTDTAIVIDTLINGTQKYQLRCTPGQFGFQFGAIADQLKLTISDPLAVFQHVIGKSIQCWAIDKANNAGIVYRNLEFKAPNAEAPSKPKLDENF